MSTLKVTNIAGLTGSSTSVIEGLAKAWVNVDGTGTISFRDSFNASSLTDYGTGYHGHSFTSTFANTGHASSGIVNRYVATNYNGNLSLGQALSSSAIRYYTCYSVDSGLQDYESLQIPTHGDLA